MDDTQESPHTVDPYIVSFISDDGEAEESLKCIIDWVTVPQNGILGLTAKLGDSLTSPEKDVRSKATSLLAEVLHGLPDGSLLRSELAALTEFFCDRSKDHHSVVPAVLRGFLALTTNDNLPEKMSCNIMLAIFEQIQVQTLIQTHRRWSFEILMNLLNKRRTELQSLGSRFSLGFIQMVDGEKDPRNLMTVFSCATIVIKSFPIDVCLEDLFEVTSCYFPVDFTPPKNDTFCITREQLADSLRVVMSSTRDFAPYCIPLLLEKISSDLQTAKQDALLTLCDCCEVYMFDDLSEFRKVFCNLLVKEVMLAELSDTEKLALQTIRAVAKCLCRPNADGITNGHELEMFCKDILKDCKHHLKEPEHKLINPTTKILQALASSSVVATRLVLPEIIPILQEQLSLIDKAGKLRGIINVTIQIMSSCTGDIKSHQKSLLPNFLMLIEHSSVEVCQVALTGLGQLSPALDESKKTANTVTSICLSNEDADVRVAACDTLALICKHHPTVLQEQMSQISTNIKGDAESLRKYSDMLVPICKYSPTEVKSSLTAVLHCCDCIVQGDMLDIELLVHSLKTAFALISHGSASLAHSDYLSEFMNLLKSLDKKVLTNRELCDIITLITADIVNITETGSLQAVVQGLISNLEVFVEHSPPYRAAVCTVLCNLPTQVIVDELKCTELLLHNALTSADVSVRDGCCKIMASLLNKSTQSANVLLNMITEKLLLHSASEQSVVLYSWVTKALLLRMHSSTSSHLDKLIEWLSDPILSSTTAEGFGIILKEHPDVLTTKQHAKVRLMYKQRFYLHVFPKLSKLFNTADKGYLKNVHLAITYLLQYVPRQVLATDETMLFTVLMKLLSSDNGEVLLRSLHVLSADTSNLVSQHTDTIIPLLLKLTQYPENMGVRIAALKCIGSLHKLPRTIIFPYMKSVIKGLVNALDDKKRVVRKEAVIARNTWCLAADS